MTDHEWNHGEGEGDTCVKCGDKDWMVDPVCSESKVTTDNTKVNAALLEENARLREANKGLREAVLHFYKELVPVKDLAMESILAASVPECGRFGEIAQTLGYVCGQIESMPWEPDALSAALEADNGGS